MSEATDSDLNQGPDPEARPERRPISKRLRFEIFKRDHFTCVYCGRTPPEVVLQIDHLEPVSAGGPDDPANLFTACSDCNLGKSDRRLENALPQVRPEEIDEMAERVEQMRAYQHWRSERDRLLRLELSAIYEAWVDEFGGQLVEEEAGSHYESSVNFPSEKTLLGYLEDLPTAQILDAVRSAAWRFHDRDREEIERWAVRRYFYAICKRKILMRREEHQQIRVTWAELVAQVPELDRLRDEVETFNPRDPWRFCADAIWKRGWVTVYPDGVEQPAQSPIARIAALVGPKSRNAGHPVLGSLTAQETATRTIQSSLPPCGQTCTCGRPKRPPIPKDYPHCEACGQAYEPVDRREGCIEPPPTEWNGQQFPAMPYGDEPWLHVVLFAENYSRWHRLATPRAPAISPRCPGCRTPIGGYHHPGCRQQACSVCGERADSGCASRDHLAKPLSVSCRQLAARLRQRHVRVAAKRHAAEVASPAVPA
jgi:hypothetical protein